MSYICNGYDSQANDRAACNIFRLAGLTTLCAQVVHCDIKPRNILLNVDRTLAKIGDVGLARTMIESQLSTASIFGTLTYAAPEVLLRQKCSSKVRVSIVIHLRLRQLHAQSEACRVCAG